MKRFFYGAGILFLVTILCIFLMEKTNLLGLKTFTMTVQFSKDPDTISLSWEPLPYPCFYRVDTAIKITEAEAFSYQHVKTDFTTALTHPIISAAVPLYYRVTAYGILGAITAPSEWVHTPYCETEAPIPISHYTEEHPASLMPFLVWHSMPNAVLYELELLSAPPEQEGGTALSQTNHIASTRRIFTNGWQADLRSFSDVPKIYWRVRALDMNREPIGEFSTAAPIVLSKDEKLPTCPLPNTFDTGTSYRQPIYPVYQWIPLHDVRQYEVELLTEPPTEPYGKMPDPNRVWAQTTTGVNAIYDEYARPYAGIYYWRVRGIDAESNTVGTWSDTASFMVDPTKRKRIYAAILGDSITHGGGAISNSPALPEYSYTTYLSFDCLNLGRSGDTSHTTLERFDADVLPIRPLNLLILTGSNSLRDDQISAQDIIEDLSHIQEKCIENHIHPVFLTILPLNPNAIALAFQTETDPAWHDKLHQVNAWIRTQDHYIDLEPYFYDETETILAPMMSTDGLHPDIQGKLHMAEIINAHRDQLRERTFFE